MKGYNFHEQPNRLKSCKLSRMVMRFLVVTFRIHCFFAINTSESSDFSFTKYLTLFSSSQICVRVIYYR